MDALSGRYLTNVPRTPEEAVDELRRCSGTQFDADVVETLIAVRNEHAVDLASVA